MAQRVISNPSGLVGHHTSEQLTVEPAFVLTVAEGQLDHLRDVQRLVPALAIAIFRSISDGHFEQGVREKVAKVARSFFVGDGQDLAWGRHPFVESRLAAFEETSRSS